MQFGTLSVTHLPTNINLFCYLKKNDTFHQLKSNLSAWPSCILTGFLQLHFA